MSDVMEYAEAEHDIHNSAEETEYLTFYTGDQLFGVPVLVVQDVMRTPKLTRIPLAPPQVAGALNLRGRIITAIDVRQRLGLGEMDADSHHMSIVVEYGDDLYNLIVDRVGEVLRVRDDSYEQNPGNLDPRWAEFCSGVHRLEGTLLLVMEVDNLLDFDS